MKKILVFLLFLVMAGLLWFVFIKKYDYEFQLQAKYGPGAVYREISQWKSFDPEKTIRISLSDSIPYKQIIQKINSGSSREVEMLWELEKQNDSITQVNVKVWSLKNNLVNRLDILNPFKSSMYVDSLKQGLLDFKKRLNEKQDTYKIKIVDSTVTSPATECICHSSKNISLNRKAWEMMETIEFLENYVKQNDLELSGSPLVKITKWDRQKDLINFDFCFPVNLVARLQETPNIQFKKIAPSNSLEAVFNGNYRSSHLAWFDLLEEAEERGYKTSGMPLEIFHDNPQSGTEAITWKAEIYLPVLKN